MSNRIIDYINAPFVSIVVPPLVGLYYGVLDIWSSEWAIINDYRDIHEFLFLCLASLTALTLFLKGISEQFRGSALKQYQNLLESMVSFFNELVKKKKDRFFKKAKTLKPNGDIFKSITQPKDQLEFVLDGTKRLLCNGFNIDPKNVGITIIQGDPTARTWWYEFKCDAQKQHTKASEIMDSDSAASYCYKTGESIFIPDFRKGEKEKVFFLSERALKSEFGSIFCKPVRIKVGQVDFIYIFTTVVYCEFLCTPYDEEECKACENLLDEVADRVELELYLHSIKEFKYKGRAS